MMIDFVTIRVPLKRMKIFNWIFIFVLCLGANRGQALVLSIQDNVPQMRLRPKEKPPGQEPLKGMVASRKAESEGNFSLCLKSLATAQTKSKPLAPWIQLARLRCAYQLTGRQQIDETLKILRSLEKNRDWFLLGPYSNKLRFHVIEARFAILEELLRKDRTEAGKLIDDLLSLVDWMDPTQRAKSYRLAGEMAFIQQKLKRAETYFRSSLNEKETPEARDRMNSLRVLMKEKGGDISEVPAKPVIDPDLVLLPKEKELAERMQNAMKTGDLVAATEDGLEIIRQFPGGSRAKWASERVFEVYQSIANKDDPKYQSLKTRVIELMEKADGIRLMSWTEKAYRGGFYADTIPFAEAALKKLEGTPTTTSLVSWAAHGYLYTSDESKAKKLFQTLVEKHAGSAEAVAAQFRLGLIEYRAKEWAAAVAHFERLLALPDSGNFELPARYWLWRCLQKLEDKARAQIESATIIAKFPLTYYGLRALAENGDNQISLPESQLKLRSEIDFNPQEKESWGRLQLLLKAGWSEEAQLELSDQVDPADAMTKALISRYWASAMGYSKALKLMNQAWNQDPTLQISPLVRVVFPFEYRDNVELEAKKYSMEPALVWSLIRQESAFEAKAVSTSNAMGLMQLIPPTGQEVASELKLKNVTGRESFFVPALNIQMGTYYLNKMLKKWDGNVAWALASYNAGPERFGRWVRARGLANNKTSDPEEETWMDDLPWSETNFYVKAILRNLLIYRTLDRGRVPLLNPVWAYEAVDKK